LNSHSSPKQPKSVISVIATTLMALAAISVVTACSPKPTAEETAAQTKVVVDQAVAEAKKQMITEQTSEKDKQDAIAAAKTAEKAKQDAAVQEAVANERKKITAEQRAANAKKERRASTATSISSSPTHQNTSVCINCGTVLSVNEIEAEGAGSGLGVVAGGVLGGVLGHQVGGGTGRDLATVAGAVGGAFAGNKIEKISKKTKSYNIVVKMNTGEERTFNQNTLPDVVRGDKVKIESDMIIRR
jgi:outer membrane lipoprotein SlyB